MSLYCSVSSFVLVAVVVKVVTTAISLACHGGHNDPRTRVGSRLPRGTDKAADSKIGYGLSDGDVLVMYDRTFYLFMHFYMSRHVGGKLGLYVVVDRPNGWKNGKWNTICR
jgi:hypothetical protein